MPNYLVNLTTSNDIDAPAIKTTTFIIYIHFSVVIFLILYYISYLIFFLNQKIEIIKSDTIKILRRLYYILTVLQTHIAQTNSIV